MNIARRHFKDQAERFQEEAAHNFFDMWEELDFLLEEQARALNFPKTVKHCIAKQEAQRNNSEIARAYLFSLLEGGV